MMKNRSQKILISLLFAIALALVLYPFFANIRNGLAQQQRVAEYDETVSSAEQEDEYAGELAAAQAWNAALNSYAVSAERADEETEETAEDAAADSEIDAAADVTADATDDAAKEAADDTASDAEEVVTDDFSEAAEDTEDDPAGDAADDTASDCGNDATDEVTEETADDSAADGAVNAAADEGNDDADDTRDDDAEDAGNGVMDDEAAIEFDEETYESLLNIAGDGMMGYVEIPAIDVKLPIYHGTTDEVLQEGAGHLATSALPVGGEGTHCVIMAHRGLPTAEMFTNLDQVQVGDVFYLRVLNETFAYEVTQISTVDPDETTSLLPVAGQDLCTLVTCTPYGVNTQRLLVTGTRTEYDESDAAETADSSAANTARRHWYLPLIAALEAAVYLYLMKRSG